MLQCVKNKWLWLFVGLNLAILHPALAGNHDRDEYKNGQKMERQHDRRDNQHGNRHNAAPGKPYKAGYKHQQRNMRFSTHQRNVASDYYGERYHRHQKCPPGLAMKHNGCMAPGARSWTLHKPLPRNVKYYSVPHQVVVKMGVPPTGYRYVRVGTDILMMAIGTRMIVDAMNDIAR